MPVPKIVAPEQFGNIRPARAERRRDTEQEAAEDRRQQCEGQYPGVQRRVDDAIGEEGGERAGAPQREQQSQHSAGRRQHDTFREELPQQAAASGAERQPDRDLPPAGGGAREQQVRDIGAGDEQYQAHDGHEDQERRPELLANAAPPFGARVQYDLALPKESGEVRPDGGAGLADGLLVRDVRSLRRLRQGHARLPARHHVEPEGVLHREARRARSQPVACHERNEDIGRFADFDTEETFRGDTDHCERQSVQQHGPSGDRGIAAETRLPEPVADDSHGVFSRRESAADCRVDAEGGEIIVGDEQAHERVGNGRRRSDSVRCRRRRTPR